MKERNVLIHMLSVILAVSALMQSFDNPSLVLYAAPILVILISVFVELEKENISILLLAGGTLSIPYFAVQDNMTDFYPLFIFLVTFIAPLMIYWIVLLSPTVYFSAKGLFLSASYLGISITVFYLIIFIFNISDYILAEENTGPQALVLIGSALLAMIPYHIWLTFKD
ncbi:MAG: hypothetical protein ACOCSL_01545 [Thermoplasmatota archaeon]